jgi:hypothetical protein
MSSDDARDLAEKVIAATDLRGDSPLSAATDLRGSRAAFHGCRKSTLVDDEWDVVYDLVASTGHRMAGGLVVIVDGKTRTARVCDEL